MEQQLQESSVPPLGQEANEMQDIIGISTYTPFNSDVGPNLSNSPGKGVLLFFITLTRNVVLEAFTWLFLLK